MVMLAYRFDVNNNLKSSMTWVVCLPCLVTVEKRVGEKIFWGIPRKIPKNVTLSSLVVMFKVAHPTIPSLICYVFGEGGTPNNSKPQHLAFVDPPE